MNDPDSDLLMPNHGHNSDDTSIFVRRPTWDCPEGICECSLHREDDPFEYTVVFCAEDGRRLPGSRFCAKVNGHTVAESTADPDGKATIVFQRTPEAFHLEWAPSSCSTYTYHQLYYVVASSDHGHEANRKRLHNLGFFLWPTLRQNVIAFQQRYGYEQMTGELSDVEHDLVAFHDHHALPVKPPQPL